MDSDYGGNTAGSGYLITAPVPFFATYIAGIGVSTAWALIAAGEIETIAVGRRRLVVIESWRNYVRASSPHRRKMLAATIACGPRPGCGASRRLAYSLDTQKSWSLARRGAAARLRGGGPPITAIIGGRALLMLIAARFSDPARAKTF